MRPSRRILSSHCAIVVLLLAVFSSTILAQTSSPPSQPAPVVQPPVSPKWNEAVSALAEKIASAISSSHTITLDVKGISTSNPAEIAPLQEALEMELMRRYIRVVRSPSSTPDSTTPVQVTISESAENYLLVGEIGRRGSRIVRIAPFPKATDKGPKERKPTFSLQRNLVYIGPEIIIDFDKKDFLEGLVTQVNVLNPTLLISHDAYSGDPAAFAGSTPRSKTKLPRDQRGTWLKTSEGQLKAYIPGVQCVSTTGLWSAFWCGPNPNQAWQLGGGLQSLYVANRNFFESFVEDENSWLAKKIPFFSVASYPFDHAHYRILTELDGKARLYESDAKPVATFSGWGDNIASIRTACDKGWKVLVTGTGDWTEPDQVQIYEITGSQAAAIGRPLDFPGPITEMWPSEDAKSARVVSRNLQTGMYEASIVSVSCSD
jgi:hypothetical protein